MSSCRYAGREREDTNRNKFARQWRLIASSRNLVLHPIHALTLVML